MNLDADSTPLRDPIFIAAFEGWNDAADAATSVIDHLLETWDGDLFAELDPDEFYDFQQVRPVMHQDETGHAELIWPTPTVFLISNERLQRDFLVLRAFEPNFRWREFCKAVLDLVMTAGVREVYLMGALLADVAHSRPVPISGSTNNPFVQERLSVNSSGYVGPVGITSALASEAQAAGLLVTSLWAAVPHYTAEPPCPKASLALLIALDEAMDVPLPQEPLRELAEAWQRGADELMDDDDLREYVQSLEENRDGDDSSEVSGDAIAREFERYLRRRDREEPNS